MEKPYYPGCRVRLAGVIFFVTGVVAFAPAVPGADDTIPMPLSNVVAQAAANYLGDGLSVTPTKTGAVLHCLFQKLDAEASTEGLWLTSMAPAS